jgi:hypothetical protein
VNVAKAGSAVAIRFSLTGYQGMDILAAGAPGSQAVSCAGSAAHDAMEEAVMAGGSALRYDAASDRYQYVWKTDTAWACSCRQFVLALADGSEYSASFRFTK